LVNVDVDRFPVLGSAVRIVAPHQVTKRFGIDAGTTLDEVEDAPFRRRQN
jgi:hypothetical protein